MDRKTHTIVTQQLAELWGAVAWRSYQIQGRGVVGVSIRQHHDDDVTLAIDYLSGSECKHVQARRLVTRYNPAVEYVLLVGTHDEDAETEVINLGRPLAEVAAEALAPTYEGVG